MAQDYACCPRDELQGGQTASGRSTQSYATLRGRKWVEKQRQACSSGVGDNFGRSVYLEDSRYVVFTFLKRVPFIVWKFGNISATLILCEINFG